MNDASQQCWKPVSVWAPKWQTYQQAHLILHKKSWSLWEKEPSPKQRLTFRESVLSARHLFSAFDVSSLVILTTVLWSRGCGTDVTFKRFISLPVTSPVRSRLGVCCLQTPRSLVGAPSWLLDSCLLAASSYYRPQCVHTGRGFSLPLHYKDTNLLTRAPPSWPCPNLITSHRPTTAGVRTSAHRFGEHKHSVHDTSELGAMPWIPLLLLCIIAAAVIIL